MRHALALTIALTLLFAGLPLVAAEADAAPERQVYDARAALEALKALEGDWTGDPASGGSSYAVRYEVTAGGNTVVKTYAPGKPNEMLTIYHMDGDTLMLTHYCALDNQPQMKFEASEAPGEMHFAFAGGTNFDPDVDAHAHEGWTRIVDENTIETHSVGYSAGQPRPARKSTLRRR